MLHSLSDDQASTEGFQASRVSDIRVWVQDFVPQLGRWVAEAAAGGEGGEKLREVVHLRRENLARIARFSCWNWILYAWNVEASRTVPPNQMPSLETAVRLLVRPVTSLVPYLGIRMSQIRLYCLRSLYCWQA